MNQKESIREKELTDSALYPHGLKPIPPSASGQIRPLNAVRTCIVCSSPAAVLGELVNWGVWCRCQSCGLEFADPLRLPEDPTVMFNRAYKGGEAGCGMEEFAHRVSIRHALLETPDLWFFNPAAIQEVLKFVRQHVPPGGTVFEVGAGLGFFLHTLKREGFHAVGLDVAEMAVDMVRNEGFEMWHGTLESVPPEFVKPDVIVSLFVLHHLEDPIGFFRLLRQRWPSARIAIAEYGQVGPNGAAAFPPRTLHRWNSTALGLAMREGGYRVQTIDVNSSGNEHPILRPVRFVMRKTIALPAVFRAAKFVQRRIMPKVLKPLQKPAYTVIGLGEP